LDFLVSDRSDAELVREVRSGQVESFNVLVRRWERKVYSYLVYRTGRREDAFDMCQEVFLQAYTNLCQLREPDRFRHWLFRIAHNTAQSRARQQNPEATGTPESNGDPAATKLSGVRGWEPGELKILFERALGELPVEQRDAIVLKFYQGFKLAEIAEIQGCPLSTAKTRLYSGFEALKKVIEA